MHMPNGLRSHAQSGNNGVRSLGSCAGTYTGRLPAPALSTWGLIAGLALLVSVAFVAMRRMNRENA